MAETTWIPGMAARDPETGWQYRAVEMQRALGWAHVHGWAQPTDARWARALAAGPDLTDLTTALVVACQNGWELFRSQGRDGGICCKYMTPWGVRVVWGKDGADAVLKAAHDKYSEAVQSAAKAKRGVTCTGCELADDCPGFADCPKLAAAKAEGER